MFNIQKGKNALRNSQQMIKTPDSQRQSLETSFESLITNYLTQEYISP